MALNDIKMLNKLTNFMKQKKPKMKISFYANFTMVELTASCKIDYALNQKLGNGIQFWTDCGFFHLPIWEFIRIFSLVSFIQWNRYNRITWIFFWILWKFIVKKCEKRFIQYHSIATKKMKNKKNDVVVFTTAATACFDRFYVEKAGFSVLYVIWM